MVDIVELDKNKGIVFSATLNIENKHFLNDPEGETILNDLILKEGYNDILSVRTAKSIKIEIIAKNIEDAKVKITEMCDTLRIYNPIVSDCKITVKKKR
jgi:phosphoribosylformylglycinamidine synthase subunit PurS